MQKKLIALAIAGLASAPVFAQTNVTIYGVADAAIGAGHSDDNDFRGVVGGVLSGNRIGFRGTEDLGNGLKAVFTLEQGFSIDNGTEHINGLAFSRQAFVGLQGSFGTVSLGRQYAPGYFANYDAALSDLISPQSTLTSGAGLSITPNSAARWDNSIAYTGTFGGLTARAIYSAQTETEVALGENQNNDDRWGASLDYANGPFKAGVTYHFVKETGANNDARKELYVGAEYNFGVLTVAGSWQNARDFTNAAGILAGESDRDLRVWQLGVIVPVTAAGKVHVAYGKLQDRDLNDADAKNWAIAYTHALSKRTTAYAAYNKTQNDDNVAIGALNGTLVPAAGENAGMAVVGMRHTF
ncbi:porin [Aromatoleum petrolei]|uniref:porin n=1 Tax=Aromatoleum petrolei TaxID=76116 RepID=UPI001AEBC94A|nr:porin [Aromatoleum petrolei]QTQ35764.1 putative outer membrane porin protein [Aromatoleum petrolei]